MDITVTIERQSVKQRFIRVLYQAEGFLDYRLNLRPAVEDFTPAGLQAVADSKIPVVINDWEATELVDEVDDVAAGVGTARPVTYTPPVIVPDPEPTPTELVAERVAELSEERGHAENVGVLWTDRAGNSFMFDTTTESQNRFVGARAAAGQGGTRGNSAVWKCAQVDNEGNPTLVFRPTSNQEIIEISNLVFTHIQKCFETEAICVAAVMAGNLDVDFATEYAAL